MGPKTQQLAEALKQLISLLERYGEQHWSTWLERSLSKIRRGDFRGVETYLSALGGMGSFNDLIIHPLNGHAVEGAEVDAVNEELQRLKSECATLAYEVKRVAVFE